MSNGDRYDSLNVSMQTETLNRKRPASQLNRTIDVGRQNEKQQLQPLKTIEQRQQTANSQGKDKYFQQLYRKNEELRRELKSISVKLSQQIDKVKFNQLRRSSVGASPAEPENKADKATKRELENAYKQVAMYKRQIQTLKSKEETEASFNKLKDLENQITDKDNQISSLQSQLKSVKAVKAMQEKKLEVDVENEEILGIVKSYEQQKKDLKNKLKQYAARERKREENYKKQQAYLYEIEKKLREVTEMYHPGVKKEKQEKKEKDRSSGVVIEGRQITEEEWRIVKAEVQRQKQEYKKLNKKIETITKQIKKQRLQREENTKNLTDKEGRIQVVKLKITELKKVLTAHNILTVDLKTQKSDNQNNSTAKIPLKGEISEPASQQFHEVTYRSTVSKKRKEWGGQQRMQQKGFANKQDEQFNDKDLCVDKNCRIIGVKLEMDEDNEICTVQAIYQIDFEVIQGQKSYDFQGSSLSWDLKNGDYVKDISGSFNSRGSLQSLVLTSKNGKVGRFGRVGQNQKPFSFEITDNEIPRFIFGATHKFGKDVRISMLGVSICPKPKD